MQLNSKRDLKILFKKYYETIYHLHEKNLNINTNVGGALYSSRDAHIEALLRPLWGLIPYISGCGDELDLLYYIEQIKNGTNPKKGGYWGRLNDYDQKMVEMVAIAIALLFLREKFLRYFNETEKQNLFNWLWEINEHKCFETNWIFFPLIVNISLKKCFGKYSQHKIDNCLKTIDGFYLGNGWYSDGKNNQTDYYVAFAIHFYSLIYAKFMENDDLKYTTIFKKRAKLFANQYICLFSSDGSTIPFGRSLIYRFAQIAFWEALIIANVDVFSLGILKGIIFRNLRWWSSREILSDSGLLSLGYSYPNIVMTEAYNAAGSPYWAFKGFIILSLPDEHIFWSVKEEALPSLKKIKVEKEANMIICRSRRHAFILNGGQHSPKSLLNGAAKYWKFAYSNLFGFSVPRGNYGLSQGAFDSMLAISDDGDRYVERCNVDDISISRNVIYTRWCPMHNISVDTWLVPAPPWHIRIHRVSTDRKINVAEGGFAIAQEYNCATLSDKEINLKNNGIFVNSDWGCTGIIGLSGYSQACIVKSVANTNIIHARTIIPTLTKQIENNCEWLVSAIYGEYDNGEATSIPELKMENQKIDVLYKNKKIFSLNTKEL